MTLNDLLKELSYGELNNLAWGNDGEGSIRADKIPMIVGYINDGLLALYTRFALKKDCLYVELRENITEYHLNSRHAFSNDAECEKYIMDTYERPFKDDLLKVIEVFSNTHHLLPLNNHSEQFSVFTPVFDVLQVPHPVEGIVLSIIYQAKHVTLSWDNPFQDINLALPLIPALKSYVAYSVYSNMNTQEAVSNATKHYQMYQQILNDVVTEDMVSTSYAQTNTKFHQRGFV